MLYFQADARDGAEKSGCYVCCCENATARPGETNKITIDYRNWAAPLMGKGLSGDTIINVSECLNCNNDETRLPVIENVYVHTVQSKPVEIIINADNAAYYEVLRTYGPDRGTVEQNSQTDNIIIYTPYGGFTGYDHIWVKVKDVDGNENIGQIIISVDVSEDKQNPIIPFVPPVSINKNRVEVNKKNYLTSFAIEVSPAAKVDDIYKITVRQPSLDCDCNKYWNEFCIDLTIGKCG